MNDKHTWEPNVRLPDGHRLFPLKGDPFKSVALADNSGREPWSTDDGVLWLDFSLPLLIGAEAFSIPLTTDDGSHTRTISDASTLLYLSATFNWPIVDQKNDNNVYKVQSQ